MSNLLDTLREDRDADIERIRKLDFLHRFNDIEVERMWRRFSYSRGVLFVPSHDANIDLFDKWLAQ